MRYQYPLETALLGLISPNVSENSIETFLHWESKLLHHGMRGWKHLCLFSKRPQGTQYRQIPGSIRSYETTHISDNPMLSAELEKVTLPQGDWQSSQEMTPRTENYLMRPVCVSHLGLESHVRWSKKVCSMPFMKQNWSTKPYFLIFGFYISRKLIPKPREVLTGSFSLSVTGTLWSQHITALSTM